jgi:hypothetical protein
MARAAIRTGEIKAARGIVDYLARGELRRGDDRIPGEIGYYEEEDPDGNDILRAAYIFIKRDGVTESGNHYYKETLYLLDNGNDIIAYDEEV